MLPTLFINHGSPMLPLLDQPARDFLRGPGEQPERPKAILVASAHRDTERPNVDAFSDLIHNALIEGRTDDPLDYRRQAPYAAVQYPTDEHWLPLYVAIGCLRGKRKSDAVACEHVVRRAASGYLRVCLIRVEQRR